MSLGMNIYLWNHYRQGIYHLPRFPSVPFAYSHQPLAATDSILCFYECLF